MYSPSSMPLHLPITAEENNQEKIKNRQENFHFPAMDFQSLTRRELQALCKKNKIPANMTNVSMADALKALENVEGIEEFSLSYESQSAQSSIESPEKSEVTSPYVPPTGGRTTRQRNVAKEEPQTLQRMTRSRYRTRQNLAKDAEESRDDETETPAMAAQSARRRAPLASACRKMVAQLNECAEEDEKKDTPMTPARLEVASRRRKGMKEDSEVKKVYSTRWSARLAEKNLEILNEVKNETSDILEKDLFMKEVGDKVEMTVNDGSVNVDEVSDITGVDSKSTVEENSQKMDDSEVSSGQIQDISIDNKKQLENNVEEEMSLHFEANNPKPEVKQGTNAANDQLSIGFETVPELDGERDEETEAPNGENGVMPLNVRNEVQDSDGSPDFCPFEIETAVEDKEELKSAKDAGSEDIVADGIENVSLGADARCDVVEEENEINLINDLECDVVEEENEINLINDLEYEVYEGGEEEPVGNMLCDEIETLKLVESEKDLPSSDELENVLACIKNSPTKQHKSLDSASIHSSYSFPLQLNADFTEEIETCGIEAKLSIQISLEADARCDVVEEENEINLINDLEYEVHEGGEEEPVGNVLCKEVENLKLVERKKHADVLSSDELENVLTSNCTPLHLNADFPKEIEACGIEAKLSMQISPSFAGMDPNLTAQTKKSANKASMTVKKSADDVSDNKENIGSGSKSVHLTKESVKIIKDTAENVNNNLNDLSKRKLTKMLKERLQIANNSSKNENGTKASTRPALQVLPENRMVDETQN